MARIYGLNGVIRGRQGSNVFAVQNGTQVLRKYQPVVANPRTLEQRKQRAKFALAGKISAATPNLAISGLLGDNARVRRARFVSMITKVATTSGTSESLTASIEYDQLRFSMGQLSLYSVSPTCTASWTGSEPRAKVEVQVRGFAGLSADAPDGYGELAIVCLFDADSSTLDEIQAKPRTTAQNDVFTFRIGTRRNCFVVVYVAPYAPLQRLSSPNASGLNGEASAVTLPVMASEFMSGMYWGESAMVSVVPVLGAQTAIAPAPDDDDR